MRTNFLHILGLAGSAAAVKRWAGAEKLPAGLWRHEVSADGETMWAWPLNESGVAAAKSEPFVFQAVDDGKPELEKREGVGCHGWELFPHYAIDAAFVALKDWAGDGRLFQAPIDNTAYVSACKLPTYLPTQLRR